MGSVSKSRATDIYGVLLYIYPTAFRRHFEATMRQTFSDMLDDTPSRSGRALVWLKTIANLPFSAAGEYFLSGKELLMTRNVKLLAGCAATALFIVGIGSFWFGTLHARETTRITHVSVVQLGDAMQHDNFYSSYGNAALIFSGKVASVSHQNGTSVVFADTNAYAVTCQFTANLPIKPHQALRVVAPGGRAVRQAHGVLLRDCMQN